MLTLEERREFGHAKRRVVKRSAQAEWDAAKRKHDPIAIILEKNKHLIRELVPLKMARMASSPFAFFRGSVQVMAADLASLPVTGMRAQICGDAHVQNLGAYAAPDGRLIFDINDFDETCHAPWEWDIKRLGASIVLAGREAENSEARCREAVRDFVRTYRRAMRAFAAMPAVQVAQYRVRRAFRGGPGSAVLRKAERTTHEHSLEVMTSERKRDAARLFNTIKPVLVRQNDAMAKRVLAALREYRETVSPERRHILDFYKLADVAFKVVGLGSVGLYDYVVLGFGNGKGDPLFLQVKEEPKSSYARYLHDDTERMHQGRRVVEGQRRMQTQSDMLLGWTAMNGRDFLVRQYADHKGGIQCAVLTGRGLMHYAITCGEILAKAHARSGDPSALAGYLGAGNAFDRAIEKFAVRYADQMTLDYEKLRREIRNGKIRAAKDAVM